MSGPKTMFDILWDVDKYKSNYDSEHWNLCRSFIETHKTKYPEQKLIHLTEAFYQMGVYGSSYDPKTTRLVSALTIEVVDHVLKAHPGTLRHPFDKSAIVVPEPSTSESQSSKDDKEPNQSSSIWDVQVDQSIIVNVLINTQLRELLKGFIIIYDIRKTSTLNDNKVSILEDSFKRSKFGPCHWVKDDTNNNICPIRMAVKFRNVVLAEAVGAVEKSLKTRLAQAVLSKLTNFSSGIEAKWSYYRDGRLPDRFENPNPRKSNIYKVMKRSQFKAMAEVISFVDTFANSDSFAEVVFSMDFSNREKKQLMEYIDKTWSTKLTYRTLSKGGVKNKSDSHIFVYHIRSGEELRRWLDQSDGENDRYRLIPPGKHRRAGSCDSNVREVLTTDTVELPKETALSTEIQIQEVGKQTEKSSKENEKPEEVVNTDNENKNTDKENKKNTETKDDKKVDSKNKKVDSKTEQECEDNLEKVLSGFVLFYDANKTSELDKDDWFTALYESFKVSQFGPLEVISENVRPLRTRCVFKWKNKTFASAEGLTETQAKTAATLQLISKLEPFTYIIQAKEEYFCGGKVPQFVENPEKYKSEICRIVRRKDLPSYYSIFQTIDDFQRNKSFNELVFGSDFSWELKNEIVVYLKAKGLGHRYFTSNNQKPWTHMAVYHTVKPEELKAHLLKNGGENEKYKLIPPPKAEPLSDKTSEEKSTKEAKKPPPPIAEEKAPVKVAEKRKQQEAEPPALIEGESENNKIQINLKKFKVDKVEYPEDTGGDFPGLILWIGIRKNSMWQKNIFNILLDSFKMSKYGELLIEESEEKVWGRREPFKKCVIKSSRKVLAVGLGESKTEAKNSASLQVLRQLRKNCYTIQAKESYFKEGKATPYDFNPDLSKTHVYKLLKRNKFKDRASILKFVDDFAKSGCPEESIFGDDFTYDERESVLDHCRKIDLNYRLMKCQSVSKNMHTHIAIFNQQPLPVIKAELINANGENDMYRLIPPGGKITNQQNEAEFWPDTVENVNEAIPPKRTTKLPVPQSKTNQPHQANQQKLTSKGITIEKSSKIPSLVNRVPVTTSVTLNFDTKGDIDNFAPTIEYVTERPNSKPIPVISSNVNAKNTSAGNNDTNYQQPEPQPQFVPHEQEIPFQEVPFGPQPLFVPPPPNYGQPSMDTPLQFGPNPPTYTIQLPSNMGLQQTVPQMEMGIQPNNVELPTAQSNQTQIIVPSVTVTVPNSPQKTDLREELAKKRQVENRKVSPERKIFDASKDRRIINTDDNDSDGWSRTVFVAKPQDTSKKEDTRNSSVGQTSAGSKDKPKDLREKLRPKGSGESTSQRNLPQRNLHNHGRSPERIPPSFNEEGSSRRGRSPHSDHRRRSVERNRSRDMSRERWRFRDRSEERIVRQREGSYERRVFHDPTRVSREHDRSRSDRRRSRSRSPPSSSRMDEESVNQYSYRFRDLWDNIPAYHADTIFMYKYVKQDSTVETDPYALLRATCSASYNIDFEFVKEQTAVDEWYVCVQMVTDEINVQPLVGEGRGRTERESSLRAALHAVVTIQKACRVIEPNYRYFCDGKTPDFIARKSPMKTSLYEIIQNLDPGTPLARYTVEMMFKMFITSGLEDLFFLATDFSYLERVLVVEMAAQMNLGWRMFGPRHPGARPDDTVSTQHICVYKQKSALQLARDLIANGGSNEKYTLVDPREYRLLHPRRDQR